MLTDDVKTGLANYFAFFPDEVEHLDLLQAQLDAEENIIDRKNFTGHVTASGLVLNEKDEVLLIFHNIFRQYQQPGGHVDATDRSLLDAALREVIEEVGLTILEVHPWTAEHGSPIHIDSHHVAANDDKGEDEHFHHDFLYLFQTRECGVHLRESEVSDYKWVARHDITTENPLIKKALDRMTHNGIR